MRTPATHYEHVTRDGLVLLTLGGSRDLLRDALMCEGAMRGWYALATAQSALVLAGSEDEHTAARHEITRARDRLRLAVEGHVLTAMRHVVDAGWAIKARVWVEGSLQTLGRAPSSVWLALSAVESCAELSRDEQADEGSATGCEPWLGGFVARVRERARPLGPSSRDGWREADRLLAAGASRSLLLRDPSRWWVARREGQP